MKKNLLQFIVPFLIAFTNTNPAYSSNDTLIASGSLWKYNDSGTNLLTSWKNTSYNDASWVSGNAQLGYGDGDETTIVSYGPTVSTKYITTYFRKTFAVSNPSSYDSLKLRILRDDGAVVYINGTEVARSNMPSGAITYYSKAPVNVIGTDESTFYNFILSSSYFVNGTNTIAVEIHQCSYQSDDISFDLQLIGYKFSCGIPTGLAGSNITTTSADLNWGAVSGAANYSLRYRIAGTGTWTTVTATTNFSQISSLSPSTNYECQVQTICSSQSSSFSPVINFSTLSLPCNVPTGLAVSNITTTSADLNWGAVSGAANYSLRYRIAGTSVWTNATAAANSFQMSSLSPSTNYECQVQTICSSQSSSFSSLVNFSTLALPCNVPTGLAVSNITTTSADLNWGAVSGAANYSLRYRIAGTGTWTSVTAATNSFQINSLSPSTNYECQVQTICSSQSSSFSSLINFSTLALPCNVPTGLAASNITTTSADLNWNNIPGAVSYLLSYEVAGSNIWTSFITTNNSFSLNMLLPNTNYEFKVQAACISSFSIFSSTIGFSTLSATCGTPKIPLVSNITYNSATVSWNHIANVSSYNFDYKTSGSSIWVSVIVYTETISLASLLSGTDYDCRVQADCGFGMSSYSSELTFSTAAAPCLEPTGFSAITIGTTSATLSWNYDPFVQNYNVQYRVAETGAWLNTASLVNVVTIASLIPSTEYEMQVQSDCGSGYSGFSPSYFFTTANISDTLIAANTSWKYLANGSSPSSSWRQANFNDASWQSGSAELGYGDGDETTVVSYGGNASNKYITTYFRKIFTVNNLSMYNSLLLNVLRDDGVSVYINGTSVLKDNLPSGSPNYLTLASTDISGSDETTYLSKYISTSYLINGTNVIAVEIHQYSASSPDISFNLNLTASTAQPIVSIVRGPYLQKLTSSGIFVHWRTDYATNTKLKFGDTFNNYTHRIFDNSQVIDHVVEISGLTAASKYFYSIGSSTQLLQADNNDFFNSAPQPGNTTPVRIWTTGDFGTATPYQDTVRNAFVNYTAGKPANFWLWLGDNAYTAGSDADFNTKCFAKYPDQFKNLPFFPCPGNHDYANIGYQSASALGTTAPYFNIVNVPANGEAGGVASGTEKYYSFNYSNVHVIMLDSYGAYNNSISAMYTWLQNDLALNAQRWTIVCFHHPAYSLGTHNSNTETEMINMRQNIIPLLESYHVDLVLSGHSHNYERSRLINGHYGTSSTFNSSMIVDSTSGNLPYYLKSSPSFLGTVYVVCGISGQGGNAGKQVGWPHPAMYYASNALYGSLIIDINQDTLSCKLLTSTGTIADQFRILKMGSGKLNINSSMTANEYLNVFPNPFTKEINISVHAADSKVVVLQVIDVIGNVIYETQKETDEDEALEGEETLFTLGDNELKNVSGIFFVRITAGDKIMHRMIERIK